MKFFLTALLSFAFVSSIYAKRFANQFLEFELPPRWECALEGSEWVCQNLSKERKKEAIIIFAAKIRGPTDSLDQYLGYLKQNKTFSLPNGNTQVSEAKYSKINLVNGHRWVDALHMGSEVPGFYTRYLATVKRDLGVVVTFSVSKDHYTYYQKLFDTMISSLKVFRQAAASTNSGLALKKKEDNLLDTNVELIPDFVGQVNIGVNQKKSGSKDSDDTSFSLILLLLIAIGIFVALKFRKKKK